MTLDLIPSGVEIIDNPVQESFRELTLKYGPASMKTSYGNILKLTRNKARKAEYTYIVTDEQGDGLFSSKTITPEKAQKYILQAREYMKNLGKIIKIDRYVGIGERAVGVTWFYDPESANIGAMQQVLAFPRSAVEDAESLKKPFKPVFNLVFLAGFPAKGMPGDQAIFFDIEKYVTYVMGPDYFGESKKGMLRMLNEYVYQKGGLVLHAGAKIVQMKDKKISVAVMGLSGTGKTTTTFSKQGEYSRPIQDDMISLWPDGTFSITENGCFAKTYGLTEATEPVIYRGTLSPGAWVENVFPDEKGEFDFSKDVLKPEEVSRLKKMLVESGADPEKVQKYISGEVKAQEVIDEYMTPADGWDFVVWTQNGRSIIPMKDIENAADFTDLPPLKSLGILNRDEGSDAATPGIVLFSSSEQTAGYFMLGETSKTSAAGKDRGKTRSPFTQPFFPRSHKLQADRFRDLSSSFEGMQSWMMNTGYIGGDGKDVENNKALKVKISHSSAMIEALFEEKIAWKKDPDFGYLIADVENPINAWLLERVPQEILNPVLFFEKQGRIKEYEEWVARMKDERRAFLKKYMVEDNIVEAVCG
ncbi:phosphoenolpyruvate carboxykinase (ATP) [candidate division WOR-3 bacterium]|nr:phosphoenolpyruvate carboxykinase (ATP) [candidate division WOR-3 bacterium]